MNISPLVRIPEDSHSTWRQFLLLGCSILRTVGQVGLRGCFLWIQFPEDSHSFWYLKYFSWGNIVVLRTVTHPAPLFTWRQSTTFMPQEWFWEHHDFSWGQSIRPCILRQVSSRPAREQQKKNCLLCLFSSLWRMQDWFFWNLFYLFFLSSPLKKIKITLPFRISAK